MTDDPQQLDLSGQEVGHVYVIQITERERYTQAGVKYGHSRSHPERKIRAPGLVEALTIALTDHADETAELTIRVRP